MKYALFLGCKIPSRLPAYEASTRAVLGHLGVTLVDLEFNCCGYPARNVSRDAFVVAAARNLALAERAGLDVLTPCTCCFGTLRHAIRFLGEDAELRSRVTQALAAEGLAWSGKTEVEHLLPVLARKVGVDALAAAVRAPRTGLRVAAQYGCHALRPSNVARFDNPMAPTIFETLIRATGATPVDWPRRLDCCGDPLHEANAPLSGAHDAGQDRRRPRVRCRSDVHGLPPLPPALRRGSGGRPPTRRFAPCSIPSFSAWRWACRRNPSGCSG